MAIKQMTYKELWKLKKEDLVNQVEELYNYIEGGGSDLAQQIKELKEEKHKLKYEIFTLKEEKKSWQDGEFRLTKLLSEERTKIVILQSEIKDKDMLMKATRDRHAIRINSLERNIENLEYRIEIYRNHLKIRGVDVEAYDTKYDHLL